MEAKQLDDITTKFSKEYYEGRVGWLDGVDFSVLVESIANSSHTDPAAVGATHPAIIVKYKRFSPGNPMHALPRGAPGGVSFPKAYEKVPVVYKPS